MRISDWSSDVCSSDLQAAGVREARAGLAQIGKKPGPDRRHASRRRHRFALHQLEKRCWVEPGAGQDEPLEIGRASCRERVWQYGENSVVAGSSKKKTNQKNKH